MSDNIHESTSVVSDYYENYTDTQKEIMAIEIRKTRNILFAIAAIFFISSLLSLLIANAMGLGPF